MNEKRETIIIKCLAAMAWADGRFAGEELGAVEAVIESFGVDDETREELIEWSKTPRTLDDVDAAGLSADDAERLLHYSVLLSFVDGEQSEKEVRLLDELVKRLGMSEDTAADVIKSAEAHARSLMPVLQA